MAYKVVCAKELHEWLERGEPVVLFDVRTPEEIAQWKIQHEGVPLVNVAYEEDSEAMKAAWEQRVRRDQRLAVICRRGRTARIVAELMDAQGYDVWVLDKGMQEWSQFYHPVTVAEETGWKLLQIQRLGKGCLSYLIVSGGEAAVVDPGRHVEAYTAFAAREGAQVKAVFDTHLHADHISGAHELAVRTGAAYFISEQEMGESARAYEKIEAHPQFRIGEVEVQVLTLPTPGHTLGSVSFLVNGRYLLTGDTIFVSGIGRPDLGGNAREWAAKLHDTVFRQIAALPDDVVVLPAHYSDPSEVNRAGYVGAVLGSIRRENEAMRMTDLEAFTELIVGRVSATPPNYQEIVEINRGLATADSERQTVLESGPNRCAVKHTST